MRPLLSLLLVLAACAPSSPDEPAGPLRGVSRSIEPSASDEAAGAPSTPAAGTLDGGAKPSDSTSPPPPAPGPTATLAEGLAIREVALFQGVKVSLAANGAKTSARTVPAIANRAGLVRVYVTPSASYAPHAVTAELHLVSNGQGLPVLRDTKTIAAPSSEGDLASTFDFDVPGSSLPPGVSYFVELLDASAPAVSTTAKNAAQYPMNGTAESMDAAVGADALKVMIVPLRYDADGSGRLPDTSANVLGQVEARTLELYPVPAVSLSVHAPVPISTTLAADGTGWSDVLATLTQLRMQENPAPDVYYFGVFAPADSLAAFCPQSCVVGLSNLGAAATDAAARASMGVLYNDPVVFGTLPHEVGHAHGRYHAPCGPVAGPDPSYPYADATIGSWGYSIVSHALFNPGAAQTPHDFMSYCNPSWTSDYTFKALFDRGAALRATSLLAAASPLPARALRVLIEEANGALRWHASSASSATTTTNAELGGEAHAVTFFASDGTTLGTATAHRYVYDHLGGATIFVPDPPRGTARVVVDGAGSIAAP